MNDDVDCELMMMHIEPPGSVCPHLTLHNHVLMLVESTAPLYTKCEYPRDCCV